MTSMLDIIGGAFIGGMLILIAMTASDAGVQQLFNYNSDAIVQSNLTRTSNIIEFDLKKMGFGIPEAKQDQILQIGQSDHLKCIAQLNRYPDASMSLSGVSGYDNIPDTIEYEITTEETIDFGDTSITVYNVERTLKLPNQTTQTSVIGKIGNNDVFQYMDQAGNPAPILQAVTTVEVTLTAFNPRVVLSPELVMTELQNIPDVEFRKQELRRILRASYWKQTRMVSKNLRR